MFSLSIFVLQCCPLFLITELKEIYLILNIRDSALQYKYLFNPLEFIIFGLFFNLDTIILKRHAVTLFFKLQKHVLPNIDNTFTLYMSLCKAIKMNLKGTGKVLLFPQTFSL